jgi:hypothetical protein
MPHLTLFFNISSFFNVVRFVTNMGSGSSAKNCPNNSNAQIRTREADLCLRNYVPWISLNSLGKLRLFFGDSNVLTHEIKVEAGFKVRCLARILFHIKGISESVIFGGANTGRGISHVVSLDDFLEYGDNLNVFYWWNIFTIYRV